MRDPAQRARQPTDRQGGGLLPARRRSGGARTLDYRICYSSRVGDWDIYLTSEVAAWLDGLQASDLRKWNRWYAEAIPHAEQLYEIYLKERAEEEAGR